jgi:hypothetical protein
MKKVAKNVEVVVKSVAQKGRPVNPNSARQMRLKELDEKRKNGEVKRGRPVKEDSARQMRLAELEAKRKNGELKKGRPSNPNSARQMRLAELEAKKVANGGKMPLGRPKAKVELEVTQDKDGNVEVVAK